LDEKLYSKILNKIKVRERSEKEILEFLEKSGVSSNDSAFVIDRLKNSKLLDNNRFAESKIRSRIYNQHWGIEKIRYELIEFGVPKDLIEEKLLEVDPSVWVLNCEKIISKNKLNKENQMEIFKLKKKLFQMGYPNQTIKQAFRNQEIKEEIEVDLE